MNPRRLLLPLVALASLCVVLTLAVALGRGLFQEDALVPHPDGPAREEDATPRSILSVWDQGRALAWAEGDPDALRALYASGSRAGQADVALLRDYVGRGLVVTGMQTQVLSLQVRRHEEDVLDLVVTDRIVGGSAVRDGAETPLPADRPSTRRITMHRVGEEWLVAEVTDHDSAEASTSSTSSSSKS